MLADSRLKRDGRADLIVQRPRDRDARADRGDVAAVIDDDEAANTGLALSKEQFTRNAMALDGHHRQAGLSARFDRAREAIRRVTDP